MMIHTDVLTSTQIHQAMRDVASLTAGTYVDRCNERESRRRERAFDVSLAHDGTLNRHRRNPGTSRDRSIQDEDFAAPYDHWGWWLKRIFELDPDAVAGHYFGREHFHRLTHGRYADWREAPYPKLRPEPAFA